MINIVYTAKTTKTEYKFDLSTGWIDFERSIRKSSIARDASGFDRKPVSIGELIKAGLDIKFEGTSPVDEAIIKILPYDRPMVDISCCYADLKRKNGILYAAIESKLLDGKYDNFYDLYDDIREAYKRSAVSMVSLYSPMEGTNYPYRFDSQKVSQEKLYENIEQIEAAIQHEYGLNDVHCYNKIGYSELINIAVAEYHADLVAKLPFIRLDIYFNKNLTQQEFDEFRAKYFENYLGLEVFLSLPEIKRSFKISSCETVLTTAEINKKYYHV